MATAAQIEANRKNALRSTGPRTEEGKDRSRRNALKHGLAARDLLPDQDDAAMKGRITEWFAMLQPDPGWPMWLAELVARESLRVEKCAREESAIRGMAALRAEHFWDDDRALDAAELGKAITKRPAGVKLLLEQTVQGCAWMAGRWRHLISMVRFQGTWDMDQLLLVASLLGLEVGEPMPVDGQVDPIEFADAEIARLEARIEELAEVDARERELAECGMGPVVEKAVKHVRRYERAALRRIEWALGQLRRRDLSPDPAPDDARRRPEPEPDSTRARTEPISPSSAPCPSAPAGTPSAPRTKPMSAETASRPSVASSATRPGGVTLASAIAGPAASNRRERRAGRHRAA